MRRVNSDSQNDRHIVSYSRQPRLSASIVSKGRVHDTQGLSRALFSWVIISESTDQAKQNQDRWEAKRARRHRHALHLHLKLLALWSCSTC